MAEFNLEGLLGNVFGGGGGNFLDEYLTPEQRAAMQRNSMLAASAALLKAGGESTRRIGIGEALGGAFEAGQAGYEKAQTGALTQMALKTKMDEAKKAKDLQKLIAGVFAPQAAAPGAAQDAAMPVNPTVARANQYRQAAQMLAMSGQGEQAMKYEDLAQKLDPRDEVQGAPFEGTNAQGDPVLLQQMKSGSLRQVAGYGAKQGAIGQPFELTGPDGKPILVQQLPDGSLRQVTGVSAKQGAPGQPIEMTNAEGKSVMVQPMPDGTFRPVAGFTPKQAAPSQPFEVSGPNGQPMLVQQLSDGTLRQVTGATPKQAAPSQPFEVAGPDGQPMLVQQLSDGTLRQVTGASPKQAAPSQPFEVSGPNGQPMLVQQLSDGTLRQVTGASPKQAAPGEPFEVTDSQGKSVLVQKMADGSLRPVSGFAPKQDAAVPPVEVTGPDGKPMLMTPQRGGGFTPIVGVGPKQNPSEKARQLAELGLTPTLENFQLLESSPNEIKLLNKMGMPVTMANVERIRRSGAASTVVNMGEGQKGFENEMRVASAFKGEQIYKDFNDMRTAYDQVNSALDQGTPIGDVAGATKVMKLLDPGSVVRESELGIAMAAAGRMDRLKNYFTQAMTGQKLTPTQRQDFKALSNELYAAAGQAYNNKRSEYLLVGQTYKFPNINTVLGAPANVPSIVRQPGGPVAAPGMGGGRPSLGNIFGAPGN